jgi:golgin subfamily A member 1
MRRTSQLERNNLITNISAKEEEIRHLQVQLQIHEQRAISPSDTEDEKVRQLLQERKRLEFYLEEAHMQLHDIKSNWTSQNLTLENQLQRLSRQVAEENGEKRKLIEGKELLAERIKELELGALKNCEELKARDNKVSKMW